MEQSASIWKIKTVSMMIGLSMVFFSNWPFELLNVFSDYLVYIATILSIFSGVQYFMANKEYLAENK